MDQIQDLSPASIALRREINACKAQLTDVKSAMVAANDEYRVATNEAWAKEQALKTQQSKYESLIESIRELDRVHKELTGKETGLAHGLNL